MEDAVNPAAGAANGKVPPASVYGGGPGQGITLPALLQADPQRGEREQLLPDA